MGIESSVDATKFVASSFLINLGRFFRKGAEDDGATPSIEDIAINATVCMLVGITLQDTFISRINPSESNWFDRGVNQMVFWILIYLIMRALLALLRVPDGAAVSLRAVFITIPIAFLFGAYASSVGFFLKTTLEKFSLGVYQAAPNLAHMLVQLVIIFLYFAREARAGGDIAPWKSRLSMVTVFIFVLLVDSAVIWPNYWGG